MSEYNDLLNKLARIQHVADLVYEAAMKTPSIWPKTVAARRRIVQDDMDLLDRLVVEAEILVKDLRGQAFLREQLGAVDVGEFIEPDPVKELQRDQISLLDDGTDDVVQDVTT